jgi:RNA polymerase sigma-54 factor
MNISIGNQLEQKQNMMLTPKMMEELKILQMPNVELAQYIEEALVDNPMLESETEDDWVSVMLKDRRDHRLSEKDYRLADDFEGKELTEYTAAPISLRQFLTSQLGELKLNIQQKLIAHYLINNIADDGYLTGDLREAASKLIVPLIKVKDALIIVQSLEPSGVGARNLKECILLQLKRKQLLNDVLKDIVTHYLDLLAARKYNELGRILSTSKEEMQRVHKLIKSLDPKPGYQFQYSYAAHIVPELEVSDVGGGYAVTFHDEHIPALRINSCYIEMMTKDSSNTEVYKYLKSKLEKARECINAIQQRKKTILKIAAFIIEYQCDFLRNGYAYMKPLTMKKVGDAAGVHESTVSRTVSNKYIQTPRGVFELKYFFSSQVDSDNDAGVSANGVKKLVANIISSEDKVNPLSDEQIRKQLEMQGISIARRTVAKYRGELAILPANQRRQDD